MSKNYIITIGRQLGSGASTIGKAIAEKFEFQYIDKEILVKASQELGLLEETVKLVDEKINSMWNAVAQTAIPEFPYGSEAYFVPTSRQLFEIQKRLMQETVKERSCVIIGRCASHIFQGYENHLRIFLQADISRRMERLTRMIEKPFDGITSENGRKHIEKEDQDRAKYYHAFTGKNWLDLTEYDFILDTSPFSDEEVKDILFHYIARRFPEI